MTLWDVTWGLALLGVWVAMLGGILLAVAHHFGVLDAS